MPFCGLRYFSEGSETVERDPENGTFDAGPPKYQRVILTIKGLKCGCHENTISKVIRKISAIRKYQVSIVLARVEFELDANRFSVTEVIKQLHDTTGYVFEEYIPPQGAVLEFFVNDAAAFCRMEMPFGVTLIDAGGKRAWKPYRLLSCCNSAVKLDAPMQPITAKDNPRNGMVKATSAFSGEEEANPVGQDRASNIRDASVGTGDEPTPDIEDGTRNEELEDATPRRNALAANVANKAFKQVTDEQKSPNKPLYQQTVFVHYKARDIGARDIESYYKQRCPGQDIQLSGSRAQPTLAIAVRQLQRTVFTLFIAAVFTAPVLVVAYGTNNQGSLIHANVALIFATMVQAIAIIEFVPMALRSLIRSGLFEMDLLIAISTMAAYAFSLVSYVFQVLGETLETGHLFETSTLLVTFVLFGRVINEAARYHAARSVSFRSLQEEKALIFLKGSSANPPIERVMESQFLHYGDYFAVSPFRRIVTDGRVVCGGSEVDESMITGEPIPVAKGRDSYVYAGTINGSGPLIVKLTTLPHENTVSRIASMVENAILTKPRVQALTDRFAMLFVPTMLAIGVAVFIAWLLRERLAAHRSWKQAVASAITYAIATLTVPCPCAIALSVPMVILIAGGVYARHGIVLRDSQKLEIARNVTDAVFDKSGTLTSGNLTVVKVELSERSEYEVKKMILSLLPGIDHPASVALVDWLEINMDEANDFEPMEIKNITSVPGKGVEGTLIGGYMVRVGNPKWMDIEVLETGHTLVCMTIAGLHKATFRLEDPIRSTAAPVIKRLRDRGINVHMISGDNQSAAKAVAFDLEIAPCTMHHSCLPEAKQAYIQGLQKEGKTVMFIGSGTNDAAALVQADVGVHINNSPSTTSLYSSDHVKEAADIILINSKLHDILILLDISKAAYRRIVLSFVWSAVYNIGAISLAAGAFGSVRIRPEWAGLGELISVLPVLGMALQLRATRFGGRYRREEWVAELGMREEKR